jgi:SAM-dependent methyltransferase
LRGCHQPKLKATDKDFLREHLRLVPPFRAMVRAAESRFYAVIGSIETPSLDLGCGDGLFAAVTFEQPFTAGIDPDPRSIDEARKSGMYLSLFQGDASAMPFADGEFASVVANCSLEHIPDLEGTLGEVHRVLRPGGRFIFSVPSHLFGEMLLGSALLRACNLNWAARMYESYFNRISRHFHTDDPQTWLKRLDGNGFRTAYHSYYLNAKSHRAFDMAHYMNIHCLLSRKLTGRWTALTPGVITTLYRIWFRRFYEEANGEPGPYLFFIAERDERQLPCMHEGHIPIRSL